MAKDLVGLAKKVAVLKEQSVEEYIAPVLGRCSEIVQGHISRRGAMVIRDEAETRPGLSEKSALSTFNVASVIATRLASQAGQCLTSVAKLIDPYLRIELDRDLTKALKRLVIEVALDRSDPHEPDGSVAQVRELYERLVRSTHILYASRPGGLNSRSHRKALETLDGLSTVILEWEHWEHQPVPSGSATESVPDNAGSIEVGTTELLNETLKWKEQELAKDKNKKKARKSRPKKKPG